MPDFPFRAVGVARQMEALGKGPGLSGVAQGRYSQVEGGKRLIEEEEANSSFANVILETRNIQTYTHLSVPS